MPTLFDDTHKPYSPSTANLLLDGNKDYCVAVEKLWEKYHGYAAPSFQREWLQNQDKHYSLFWEMFLTCQLLDHGYVVEPALNDSRPDICLNIDGKRVWIECCAPTRGNPDSPDYESELPYDGTMRGVNHDASALRCTNTLIGKKSQHLKWLQKAICKPDEPFIIAMSGVFLDLRVSRNMMPGILRALYAMGDLYTTFTVGGDGDEETGYQIKPELRKQNKSKVQTNFFMDADNEHIAGVIYSTDWLEHASSEPDYCYVRNINSAYQTDWGFDKFMQTYIYTKKGISLK